MKLQHMAFAAVSGLLALCQASTLAPPVLPLTVRTPYFSTWLQNAREEPWSRWPMFWTGQQLGFAMMAAVPGTGKTYPLLGRPQDFLDHDSSDYTIAYPTYLGARYDASITNLTYQIPGSKHNSDIEIVISFLSPITPTSTLRQSLPASYLNVYVEGSSDVSIYVDVNGQWVSGDTDSNITWSEFPMSANGGSSAPPLRAFKVQRAEEWTFAEINDRAEWGSLYFTGPYTADYQIGDSKEVRGHFAKHGTLQNTVDMNFRSIWHKEPIFAYAKTFALGNSSTAKASKPQQQSVMFTLAHVQVPVVQFAAARGLTFMRPLWIAWLNNAINMLVFHYFDFRNAAKLAAEYSSQLAKDAYKSGAEDYVDIVALSARQVLGATSFSGTPDNPILFLKEISSNGNSQTVDVIYPAFPFFMYTNPRWLAYLLEPLLEHQAAGLYPNNYTMHDLGTHFPNQTGHADGRDEYMPLEECGDILVMGLSLVNSLLYESSSEASSIFAARGLDTIDNENDASAFGLTMLGSENDMEHLDDRWGGSAKGVHQAKKWIEPRYKLWKQWTEYLVEMALEPHNQLSTDDFAGPLALQTNLALKGIIGIKAMSQLAAVMGNDEDVKHYKNISDTYIPQWQDFAMSRDGTHAKLAYDWYGSWTTLYNLFGDALLCFHLEGTENERFLPTYNPALQRRGIDQKVLNTELGSAKKNSTKLGFVPREIYTKQSDWYYNVRQKYGLPLENRHTYTKTDWEFFAMAVASNKTRSTILQSVALWLNETSTDRPFTDLHETEGTGQFPGPNFFARPVVGGHFAFLTLERACGGNAMEGLQFLEEHEALKEARPDTQRLASGEDLNQEL